MMLLFQESPDTDTDTITGSAADDVILGATGDETPNADLGRQQAVINSK